MQIILLLNMLLGVYTKNIILETILLINKFSFYFEDLDGRNLCRQISFVAKAKVAFY